MTARFVDSSSNALPITLYGRVTNDTTMPVVGAADGAFSLTGNLTIPISPGGPLDISSGDYTIEFWYYATYPSTNGNSEAEIIGTNGNQIYIFINDLLQLLVYGVPGISGNGLSNVVRNAWNHCAIVVQSNVLTCYSNGVANTPQSMGGRSFTDTSLVLGNNSAVGYQGNIDEFRFSKGIARYTSNFTPPTTPFTSDANTSLLIHFEVIPLVPPLPVFTWQCDLGSVGYWTMDLRTGPTGTTMAMRDDAGGLEFFRATDGGLNGAASWTQPAYAIGSGGAMGLFTYSGNGHWQGPTYPGTLNYSTDDGVTWNYTTTGLMGSGANGGASDGAGTTIFSSNSGNSFEWSVDGGATWHNATGPAGANYAGYGNLLWDGAQFVSFGSDNVGSPANWYVYTAPTGFTGAGGPVWTQVGTTAVTWLGDQQADRCLSYDPRLGYILAVKGPLVGGHTQPGFVISKTPAGLASATVLSPPCLQNLFGGTTISGVWAFNGVFFVGTHDGNFATSTDGGVTWNSIIMPYDLTLSSPDYVGAMSYDSTNNTYIVLGDHGSLMTAPGPSGPSCDPAYYLDALLVHFDGVQGSTTFTDSSVNNFPLTANSAVVSTSFPMFGTGCLGPGGTVTTPITGVLDLSTASKWTIEGWIKYTSGGDYPLSFGAIATNDVRFYINPGGYLQCAWTTSAGSQLISANVATNDGLWHAFAAVYDGTYLNLYVDGNGNLSGPTTVLGTKIPMTGSVYFGGWPGYPTFQGSLDEVRVTIGSNRYVASVNTPYTPSTTSFGGSCTALVQGIQPKFVPATNGKAIMLANAGNINPRIYVPPDDVDVRVQPPRLPL